MRVDPRHLKIVLAIAEHGTFNRAAAALGVSQPALSKSVSQLERALGARLFDRSTRGTELTDAGRIVVRNAHNVEEVIARAQREIRAHESGHLGPLAIGATPSMMLGILPHALHSLAGSNPDFAAHIVEGLDGALLPALKRGEIELLLGPFDATSSGDVELAEEPLCTEAFFVGVPRDHPLATGKSLEISEIIGEAWILPSAGSSFHRVIEALFLAAGHALPENAIVSNSLPLQEALVAATRRLCMLTPAQFVGRTAPFNIVPLIGAPIRTIGIRHLSHMRISPLAQALIPHLRTATQMFGLGNVVPEAVIA